MNNEDLLEEGGAVFESFLKAFGEKVAPYFTPSVAAANMEGICSWSIQNLPGGASAAREIGFWELGFNACLSAGRLTRDPTSRSKAEKIAAFKAEAAYMPASLFKEKVLTDPEFKRLAEES